MTKLDLTDPLQRLQHDEQTDRSRKIVTHRDVQPKSFDEYESAHPRTDTLNRTFALHFSAASPCREK